MEVHSKSTSGSKHEMYVWERKPREMRKLDVRHGLVTIRVASNSSPTGRDPGPGIAQFRDRLGGFR